MDLYYQTNYGEFGPVSVAELKRAADSGEINEKTLVRKGLKGRWVPAAKVKGLKFSKSETSATSWEPNYAVVEEVVAPPELPMREERIEKAPKIKVKTKYWALRKIVFLHKIQAFFLAGSGVSTASVLLAKVVYDLVTDPTHPIADHGMRIGAAIASLVAGTVYFIFCWSLAESIEVFLDLEENSRKTNALMRRLAFGEAAES